VADPITWLDVLGAISPFLAALVAVGGVILTLIVTNRREGQRQEREIAERRWSTLRDERRQSYYEYWAAWETCEEVRTRLNQPFTPNRISAHPELGQAQLKLLSRYNALSLLAPTEVRKAALGMREGKPKAPGQFWEAAREDLGIPKD
jgi:hypothetical protein